ncbi:MAG: hypothetical protein ACOVQ4_23100 [Flectobacillus sp.]|uniref:hypothetical protein n=1 Tax=Flectobacillus sp. TaxID=50419 RepID=UPI003B9A3C2C
MQIKLTTKMKEPSPKRTPFGVILLSSFLVLSILANIFLSISEYSCSKRLSEYKNLNDSIRIQHDLLLQQLHSYSQSAENQSAH